MSIGYSTVIRNGRLTVVQEALDADLTDPAELTFYTAPQPATGVAITTQTALAVVTCFEPSGTILNGVFTFGTFTGANGVASGEAVWARATDSHGVFVADLSAGEAGSGAAIILDDANIISGQPVAISSGQIVEGNA